MSVYNADSITLRRFDLIYESLSATLNDSMSNLVTLTTVNRSNTWGEKKGLSSWVQRYNYLILGNSSGTVLTLSISNGPDSIFEMLGFPEDITYRLLNICWSHFFPKVKGSIRRTGRVLISIVA